MIFTSIYICALTVELIPIFPSVYFNFTLFFKLSLDEFRAFRAFVFLFLNFSYFCSPAFDDYKMNLNI